MHGGMRNYVERLIETIKDRLRGFDCYFPSPKKLLDSALRFSYARVGFYNYARFHLSFGKPPRPLPGANELDRLKAIAVRG